MRHTLAIFHYFLLQGLNSALQIDPSLNGLDQEDARVIAHIQRHMLDPIPLVPDSLETMDLSVPLPSYGNQVTDGRPDVEALQGQYGQPVAVDELFDALDINKTDLFYVEAGAFDGIRGSNTLRLERHGAWSGLLVEPHPEPYKLLRHRNRRAWTLPTCLSRTRQVESVEFHFPDDSGSCCGVIDDDMSAYKDSEVDFTAKVTLQCVPLYSVLRAANRSKVDLLALDIEGSDLSVLQTLPFDKLEVSVIMLESTFIDRENMIGFLSENGFLFYRRLSEDDIYIHQSLIKHLRD